jgi:hypothetical protein
MTQTTNWSFITHITDHLTKPSLSEQKAPTLWPSSATAIKDDQVVGKCRRQAFFRYAYDNYLFSEKYDSYKDLWKLLKEKKLPTSPYSQWIFRQGDLYEDYCVDMAKESGVFIATQVSVYVPEFNISGKIDLVVLDPTTSKYHIVEVKSVYGFNANSVLGTESSQKKGFMGEPRDAHLMQLGIYQWWYGNTADNFGEGLLVYGSRDTGRFGEYKVTVETDEDGLDYIYYQGCAPIQTQKVNSGISIQSILSNYKYLADSLEENNIPARDYELKYSEERIEQMYQDGLLGKVDTAQHEKRKKQIEEGKSRVVKPVEKGDWQCRFCDYKNVCYDRDQQPVELTI